MLLINTLTPYHRSHVSYKNETKRLLMEVFKCSYLPDETVLLAPFKKVYERPGILIEWHPVLVDWHSIYLSSEFFQVQQHQCVVMPLLGDELEADLHKRLSPAQRELFNTKPE